MPLNLTNTGMKFVPLLVVGTLTVASLAVLTSAWGHPSGGERHERHYGKSWKVTVRPNMVIGITIVATLVQIVSP